jgi:chromosome partitioning protein
VPAKIISLINYKGGVGKTTSSVNISANLAKYHEKKVLLVDADPQTNATVCVMDPQNRYLPIMNEGMTARKIFEDCGKRRKSWKIEDIIIRGVVEKNGIKVLPGLDLLPSDPALLKAERWLAESNSPYTVLLEQLEEVKDDYHYIIIDCAPNLYSLTKNCILASDYYVVPMIPDYLSTYGLNLLVNEIYDYSQDMNRTKPTPIELKAVMFTRYKATSTIMHDGTISDVSGLLMNQGFPDQGIEPSEIEVLSPPIRDNIDNAYAQEHSLPLCIYNPNSKAAIEYRQLTDNFKSLFE